MAKTTRKRIRDTDLTILKEHLPAMKTELITASLKLEGEIFRISRQVDGSMNLHEYVRLKKELNGKQVRHEQYQKVLQEMNKQEVIKKAKRKILRRWSH